MLWIKRNLFFVLSMAVGVVLIGWAGYSFYSVGDKNGEVVGELTNTREQLKNLKDEVPPPTVENIDVAKEEAKNVEGILNQFRTAFTPFPPPPPADERKFKAILEASVQDLRRRASNATVELPANYAFAFSGQIERLEYPAAEIAPWLGQLEEIKAICEILFNARVAALDSIQRVPVAEDDSGSGDYLMGITSLTNQVGVWTPYKITFRGYSEQIGDVLEGFAKSRHCWVVKDVDVRPSMQTVPVVIPQEPEQPMQMPMPQYYRRDPRMDPRFQGMGGGGGHLRGGQSYDMFRRPQSMMQQQFMQQPQTPAGPVTILSPRILYVTLSVDLVKLKQPETPTNAPSSRPNSRSARPTAATPTP